MDEVTEHFFHNYADIGVLNGSNLVIFSYGRSYRAIIHNYADIGVLNGSHLVMNHGFHIQGPYTRTDLCRGI